MISRKETPLTDFTSTLPRTIVVQVQCPSTGIQSKKQLPDRTSAQQAVFKKDMVIIYQKSPEYLTLPLMTMTDLVAASQPRPTR